MEETGSTNVLPPSILSFSVTSGPLLLNLKANNLVFLLWLHHDKSPMRLMAASCFSAGGRWGWGGDEGHKVQRRMRRGSHPLILHNVT